MTKDEFLSGKNYCSQCGNTKNVDNNSKLCNSCMSANVKPFLIMNKYRS